MSTSECDLVGCTDDENVGCSESMSDWIIVTDDEIFGQSEIVLQSRDLCSFPKLLLQPHQIHVTCLNIDFNNIQFLPEEFGHILTHLINFSCCGNALKQLPESFGNLHRLKCLKANENDFVVLPESFTQLHSLNELHLLGNRLESLPDNFGWLSNLEQLQLSENKLGEIPISLTQLKELSLLDLSSNSLTSLPPNLEGLVSLKVLNLSTNELRSLPDSFGLLTRLKCIDFSNNSLANLPSGFSSPDVIEKIHLDNNVITTLPDWFNHLTNLREFTANDNHIGGKPLSESFCCSSSELVLLELGGNFISELPKNIGNLKSICRIHLGSIIGELERANFQNGNWLFSIPDSFGLMSSLTSLRLDENQLTHLPSNFGCLENLDFIDLGQNRIRFLPDSFCRLKKLRVCLLSKNLLEKLPEEFGELSSCEELKLDNNNLTDLPSSFHHLTDLSTLDLFNNHLKIVPTVLLNNLKKLIRLDMLENDFDLDLTQIPELSPGAKYIPRDPKWEGNWRGVSRADQELHGTGHIQEVSCSDVALSNGIQVALAQSQSLWRSHDDRVGSRPITKRLPSSNIEVPSSENWDMDCVKMSSEKTDTSNDTKNTENNTIETLSDMSSKSHNDTEKSDLQSDSSLHNGINLPEDGSRIPSKAEIVLETSSTSEDMKVELEQVNIDTGSVGVTSMWRVQPGVQEDDMKMTKCDWWRWTNPSCKKGYTDSLTDTDTDSDWSETDEHPSPRISTPSTGIDDDNEDAESEDWDKELELMQPVNPFEDEPVYQQQFVKFCVEPVETHRLIPSDIHPTPVRRVYIPRPVVEGQFDDADE